ncbi:MAG: FlgD immunoglobulin-like domain containing protein [Ignavibacteria bacterium]
MNFESVNSDFTEQNFLAELKAFKISGTITDNFSNPLEGVSIYFGDIAEPTITNSDGYYEKVIAAGWSGKVVPNKTGYEFTPIENYYSNLNNDYVNENFSGLKKDLDFNVEIVLNPVNSSLSDEFGCSVSIDNNFAVIGDYEYYDAGKYGAALIYELKDSKWTLHSILTPDIKNTYFGYSVDIDGDRIIVGATEDDDGKGAVYFYHLENSVWVLKNKLSNGIEDSDFGCSVAISGDKAVVGAQNYLDGGYSNSGRVFFYEFADDNWSLNNYLYGDAKKTSRYFGASVAIDNNHAVVGSWGNKSVYIFNYNGSSWDLVDTKSESVNYFGHKVTMSNNTIGVGSYYRNGSVSIYEKDTTGSWILTQELTSSTYMSFFGYSLSIDGDYLAVGAKYEDIIEEDDSRGAIYVFKKENNSWNEKHILSNANNQYWIEYLGQNVSLSNGNIISGCELTSNHFDGLAFIYGDIDNYRPHIISGIVKDESDTPKSGVEILYNDNVKDTTGADGKFERKIIHGWQGEITPNLIGWIMEPESIIYDEVVTDMPNQNIVCKPLDLDLDGGTKIFATTPDEYDRFGVSMASNDDLILVGASRSDEIDTRAGSAYLYKYENDSLNLKIKLIPDELETNTRFGTDVDISVKYIVAGTEDQKVFTYENIDGTNWILDEIIEEDSYGDSFGVKVAVSDNYLAVAAPEGTDSDPRGRVYIYKRNRTNVVWDRAARILGSDDDGQFGESISIYKDKLIIGGSEENSWDGIASIYLLYGDEVTLQFTSSHPENETRKYFGKHVAIYDNFAAISSEDEIFVYQYVDDSWSLHSVLTDDRIERNYCSMEMYDNYIAFSNHSERVCLLYKYSNGNWELVDEIYGPDAAGNDYFGNSLTINKNYLVVGAEKDDEFGVYSGAIYFYADTSSSLIQSSQKVNLDGNLPKEYSLSQNYPNPFNPTTIINYGLPEKSDVKMKIYDITGRLIKIFNITQQSAGYHNIAWNGRNNNGTKVASGVYIYRMQAIPLEGGSQPFIQTKKMILLK